MLFAQCARRWLCLDSAHLLFVRTWTGPTGCFGSSFIQSISWISPYHGSFYQISAYDAESYTKPNGADCALSRTADEWHGRMHRLCRFVWNARLFSRLAMLGFSHGRTGDSFRLKVGGLSHAVAIIDHSKDGFDMKQKQSKHQLEEVAVR